MLPHRKVCQIRTPSIPRCVIYESRIKQPSTMYRCCCLSS
jgi:hypothetical protein